MSTTDNEEVKKTPHHYPVFKGLGRKPTYFGIPTVWFLGTFMAVAMAAMLFGLILWGSLIVILPVLAIITKTDDRALDVWILELKTRWRNKNKSFWNGSSYTPLNHPKRRPWRKFKE